MVKKNSPVHILPYAVLRSYLHILKINIIYVEQTDFFVKRSDYGVERSDLERSEHGTK